MNVRSIARLSAVLFVLGAVACGSDNGAGSASASAAATGAKPAPSGAATTAATGAGSAKPSAAPAASAAPPAGKPDLEEVKNEKMGYSIMLPKGSTTASSDQNGGSYAHDTMVIMVSPTGVPNGKPDDLLRGVNTDGGKVEKTTEGDMFVATVVKDNAPYNLLAGPKGAKFMAQCMSEPSDKDLAKAVCSSIKPLKK